MKRILLWGVIATGFMFAAVDVGADNLARRVTAKLEPFNEVPAVLSPASGTFVATIHDINQIVEYRMTFEDLQAPITQSHIHFAQPNVNGAIMVWLCGTSNNPPPTAPTPGPAGTQTCPQEGTITGTITPANVLAIGSQGIAAGNFEDFVEALRSGLAYANIHTVQSPGGEIRGQVKATGPFGK